MKFLEKLKNKITGERKTESTDRSDDRSTVYTPMPEKPEWTKAEKPKTWTEGLVTKSSFEQVLKEFKDKPSPETLKPLEQYVHESLSESKIQNAIRSLPEEKCAPEMKQTLNKQLGDAIVKMATSQQTSR